jgi:hypothetical protein
MGPCHHSMVHPQVVYGGYGLQIWRVGMNTMNKQYKELIRSGSQAWGLG